ncbi:MAG: HIT family protein [Actinomycetaceae bacterium]|nr:HIT family protein [Actinomycetaceae bacterium]
MSVFTSIIEGNIPGRFIYADDTCAVFATIEPIQPGHMLVVPRQEVNKFTELNEETWTHLSHVAQIIGRAGEHAFEERRAMIIVAGLEVPHVHIHVIPARDEKDIDFSRAHAVSNEELDMACTRLRASLKELGYGQYIPKDMYHLDKN